MKEVGILRILTSILRRQNTVAQFIATRPIKGLCEVAVRRRGTRVPRRWWEQTRIDWKAAREKAEAKDGDDEAEAAEPDLTGSDSEPKQPHRGGDRGRHRGGGVPGSKRLQWSGVERSGAEWSGVERSGAEWSGVERMLQSR